MVCVKMTSLRPFQKRFLKGALAPDVEVGAMSIPRGNGKSWLAARILTDCLTPGTPMHQPGAEYLLGAASVEQARLTYRFIREWLEPTGRYRFIDSVTRLGITETATNTKLRAISSNAKTSFGIVGVPLAVLDEPGALDVVGGTMLADSLFTAQGKPGSRLKLIMIGTLAPATSGWWHELIQNGTNGTTYVQALQGDPDMWDSWQEIRRCNPLVSVSADFRRRLLMERDGARADSRLKARFLSYRLNVPSGDESTVLLTLDDWRKVEARPTPERQGRPIVACDLGGGRAWSAAVALYENGRLECLAVAPGVPDLTTQEKRDRVPDGQYRRLYDKGQLRVAEGLRVQPPAMLWESIRSKWGRPASIICDRFRLAELQDAVGNAVAVEPRISRWSDAAYDIRSLRKLAMDGPLAVDADSSDLFAVSLSHAAVKNDDQGNVRLSKRSVNNEARDDVAAALVLASGAYLRALERPKPKWRYAGAA